MPRKSFVQHVREIREEAIAAFCGEYEMNRERFNSIGNLEWHTIEPFKSMELVPLGGYLRFPGSASEEIGYKFGHRREIVLLGGVMAVEHGQFYWYGTVKSSEGTVDDAAREAIIGLLELAYLRGKRS